LAKDEIGPETRALHEYMFQAVRSNLECDFEEGFKLRKVSFGTLLAKIKGKAIFEEFAWLEGTEIVIHFSFLKRPKKRVKP
jgi:hypothetical protein